MSSFGYVVGETASLPPSGSLYLSPAPWRPPSSIPHPPPIVRANSLSELSSLRPPRAQNSVELGPGRPKIPQQASKPSLPHLPRPLASWLEKVGNKTFGGASPGDLVLSITSPGRMVEWPSQNRVPLVACSSDE